ncbi:GNAT family N-acetyltransferase [Novosphingobium sp. ST904]|uniref:GNAT family N-acetyltransferase n=2 Tax=Novosphingobium sp. ST904 TaxID=1684385 RepID=UPI001053CD21|nr:GNAT family N-acetyltransferase [Novosphingobium sp. ST904]TCM40621.1 ribosomal protein S18 acetylase RimI-like enzyme [Novosphingobium sp. ST904]
MTPGIARTVRVEPCDPHDPEAVAVMERLSEALAAITGDGGTSSFDPADVLVPRALFVVARNGEGAVIGCGAYRPLEEEVAEIKRMYADQGCGAAVLAALEAGASADGYREVRLSTRKVNTRATAFYRRHGYAPVAAYGRYVGREESVCMGRVLDEAIRAPNAGKAFESIRERLKSPNLSPETPESGQ